MKKYVVKVTETTTWLVVVEGGDSAYEAADRAQLPGSSVQVKKEEQRTPVMQLGEPWLRTAEWYDLHEPGDVVVFETAFGRGFSRLDLVVLQDRLESLGLRVLDRWNGGRESATGRWLGVQTVSFRCDGRVGTDPFTPEQQAVLTAPRPNPDGRLRVGDYVRVDDELLDVSGAGREHARAGALGRVHDVSDAHGLSYEVAHLDGGSAWYESEELRELFP